MAWVGEETSRALRGRQFDHHERRSAEGGLREYAGRPDGQRCADDGPIGPGSVAHHADAAHAHHAQAMVSCQLAITAAPMMAVRVQVTDPIVQFMGPACRPGVAGL